MRFNFVAHSVQRRMQIGDSLQGIGGRFATRRRQFLDRLQARRLKLRKQMMYGFLVRQQHLLRLSRRTRALSTRLGSRFVDQADIRQMAARLILTRFGLAGQV
jgi:hypothetical protein